MFRQHGEDQNRRLPGIWVTQRVGGFPPTEPPGCFHDLDAAAGRQSRPVAGGEPASDLPTELGQGSCHRPAIGGQPDDGQPIHLKGAGDMQEAGDERLFHASTDRQSGVADLAHLPNEIRRR